jgi:hypothetical protein
MMLSFFILPGLIYFAALFFWGRFLYIRSLKKTCDRDYFIDKILLLALYIPPGLQAILLFCFSLVQIIPLAMKLAGWTEFVFLKGTEGMPDFYAVKIILTGSLVVVLNHFIIIKTSSVNSVAGKVVSKSLAFATGLFFLKVLQVEISHSIAGHAGDEATLIYNSNYLFVPGLFAVVFFALIKGSWIYKKQYAAVKYFSLASKILIWYIFLVMATSIPCIFYLLINSK